VSAPAPARWPYAARASPTVGVMRSSLVTLAAVVFAATFSPGRADGAPATVLPAPDVVGAFTTLYPCCQPRVVNIRRAAHGIDGRALASGDRFSLNAALGPRTRAKGYVPAPMIAGGRLVDSVGGGISQVATTLYNAAFFAGLELIAHTPHSFYIDRYPMGREATVSWGGPELIFRNQWAAPVRVRVATTRTSVTVRLVGPRLGRRVHSWIGDPYRFELPSIRRIINPALPPGSSRVVQEAGPPGFTVEYGRAVYRRERSIIRERFRVRYLPENKIVEIGPR
jgi:vancomycin resistance protein YoaR